MTEEFEGGTDYKIAITFDKEARTLSIEDNGLGMSGEEIKNTSTRLRSVVQKNLLRNMNLRITKQASLDILVWDFILRLWFLQK